MNLELQVNFSLDLPFFYSPTIIKKLYNIAAPITNMWTSINWLNLLNMNMYLECYFNFRLGLNSNDEVNFYVHQTNTIATLHATKERNTIQFKQIDVLASVWVQATWKAFILTGYPKWKIMNLFVNFITDWRFINKSDLVRDHWQFQSVYYWIIFWDHFYIQYILQIWQ